MAKKILVRRVLRPTLLVVGEGYAEYEFLCHIRSLYCSDMNGCAMSVRNAKGKGAAHVVDHAIKAGRAAAYDQVAALLDTDTDWNDKTARSARQNGVIALLSEPCLESVLLNIHGVKSVGLTADRKNAFRKKFGGEAHDDGLVEKHFSKDILDQSRERVGNPPIN
jgi:hypothetical protein